MYSMVEDIKYRNRFMLSPRNSTYYKKYMEIKYAVFTMTNGKHW